jgi:hypothetical protein
MHGLHEDAPIRDARALGHFRVCQEAVGADGAGREPPDRATAGEELQAGQEARVVDEEAFEPAAGDPAAQVRDEDRAAAVDEMLVRA